MAVPPPLGDSPGAALRPGWELPLEQVGRNPAFRQRVLTEL